MTNLGKIKRMLELGGAVSLAGRFSYEDYRGKTVSYKEKAILIKRSGAFFLTSQGGFLGMSYIRDIQNPALKFIPNPPKEYNVGDKVRILNEDVPEYHMVGKVEAHLPYGSYKYAVRFSAECGANFHHFDLEPAFD